MNLIRFAIIAVLIVTFLVTITVYPTAPDRIVSHWDAAGEADGSMSKFWGLFLIPIIMTGFVALLAVLPRIDPHKKNYEKFRDYYDGFILLFALFLLAIQVQIILWSIGYQISPNITFPILIGMLFIYLGFLLEHAEQNWFVGIRTPWTLSSTTVWKKTHELGGKLFKIAGVISCLGVFAGVYALLFVLIPALIVAVITVAYSYYEFQKELKNGERTG
ncbi:MAG: DUF1648 domain-containing protein [Methanoregula sp.]|nr:DUF1648 domain-containing protein [Methanoregula sp.]